MGRSRLDDGNSDSRTGLLMLLALGDFHRDILDGVRVLFDYALKGCR
jgi:hypothetical protein